ncbi:S24 family peptidase [Neisseria sp. ZJ106]|uniref:S24 family peptidase n=1 Tax=Neisseria lisongii TaxID=2912188 RepID=A0ABY7RIV7_9NEIS|nr:S24 family peptidase [Neisseria lisongii]MCF7520479.1 S24 family peptidase [Neisseria lisongii]WCL71579.1 S24 family peptidase [Neisseria lisongii]
MKQAVFSTSALPVTDFCGVSLHTYTLESDCMLPTFHVGDTVGLRPCGGFIGEGVYLLQSLDTGAILLRRVCLSLKGLRLVCDNPIYRDIDLRTEELYRHFRFIGKTALQCRFFEQVEAVQ